MLNKQENSDLIQEYLEGKLSAKKHAEVESRIQTDHEFKQQFLEEQLIFEAVVNAELFELEKEVRSFEPKQKGGNGLNKLMLIILSIVLLGGSGYLALRTTDDQEHTTTSSFNKKIGADSLQHEMLTHKTDSLEQKDSIQPKNTLTNEEDTLVTEDLDSLHLIQADSNTTIIADTISTNELKTPDSLTVKDTVAQAPICGNKFITFKYNVQETCYDLEDGSIFIFQIRGGTPPYSIEVEDGYNLSLLGEGDYTIHIIDQDQCQSKKEVIYVSSKDCSNSGDQEFVLSISQKGFFTLPSSGRFMVFSSNGEIVFTDDLEQGDKWFGLNTYGQPLQLGDYNYLISNNDEKTSGVITVLE